MNAFIHPFMHELICDRARLPKEQVSELALRIFNSWLEGSSSVSMTLDDKWLRVIGCSCLKPTIFHSAPQTSHTSRNETVLQTISYSLPEAPLWHIHIQTFTRRRRTSALALSGSFDMGKSGIGELVTALLSREVPSVTPTLVEKNDVLRATRS